jgi:EAL domain-containing protein (putative c-di-GMP-specific phosphodiesterase class I)/CheY-like chemotaxis protein
MEPIRVLVAEDEQEVRDVLAAVISTDKRLRLIGTAEEAESAIEFASRERPDVALVDVRMPGGGGARAAREIVRRSPSTKVIAVSAFEDAETILAMLRAGASFYVAKSDPTDQILQAIHRSRQEAPDSKTEIERVVIAFDEWQDRRRQRPSLEEVRAARVDAVLRPGGMALDLRPVVRLVTGEVVGEHASAVFASTDRSFTELLADAQAVGMLKRVELAFIEVASGQLDHMPQDRWLSIAVSPETARSAHLLDLLDDVPRNRLVLQLTDPDPVFDRVGLERAVHLWRAVGARVAMRDVGCGAESLRWFVRIRPEFVWLDPVLSAEIERDRTRQKLVRALVSMGSDMGSTVIADGVETREAEEVLLRLGIELGHRRVGELSRSPVAGSAPIREGA